MTAEKRNNTVNEHENSPVAGETGGRRFPGRTAIPVLLGLLLFAVLSLVFLSVDEERESAGPAPESDGATATASSEPPASPPEISPRAQEDFRASPTDDLAINPEPIEPSPPPGQDVESGGDEEPALAGQDQEPQAQPREGEEAPASEDFSPGEALARYMITMQDALNRDYVENCIQYRRRNGLDSGCPENPAIASADANREEKALVDDLFAIITRRSDYARISQRLEQENETLAAILDDPANPAARQASTKIALNNSYLNYLKGNPSPAVTADETMNDFINDYNRTIKSGPVQFRCKGGPCIYEYTGPGEE